MGMETKIQHFPSFVCFDDFSVQTLGAVESLPLQSMKVHDDKEDINLKQFITLGGLQRALVCLLAGNLPFYQARIEELLNQHKVNFGEVIKDKPGTPKTASTQLMNLIEENDGPSPVLLPFGIKQEKTTNFYKHWKGGVATLRDIGSIAWITNNRKSFEAATENEIGNQLAGSIATAEFANSVSDYLQKLLYIFPKNLNPRFLEMDNMRMLQSIFAAFKKSNEYFSLENNQTVRSLDPDFFETFVNLTFTDSTGAERPVVEHRHHTHPIIRLKPEHLEDFTQVVENKEGILSGKDKLVFVQAKSENLAELQRVINAKFDKPVNNHQVSISIEEVRNILGEEFDNLADMFRRNGIMLHDSSNYVFDGKILFFPKGNSAIFPSIPAEKSVIKMPEEIKNAKRKQVIENIEGVLALQKDGLIDGKKLQDYLDGILQRDNKKEQIRTVYDSFRYFYFNTEIPEGTLFRLDEEQFNILTKILEDWEKAHERYQQLISKEGQPEVQEFFHNDFSFGEYRPNKERHELTHSLLTLLTTKLSMENRKRAKKSRS